MKWLIALIALYFLIANAAIQTVVPGARIYTNSYSGTNVFIDFNNGPMQVVLMTNEALFIWTNTGGLGPKEMSVSCYNNGATNMTIWHSAGQRFMGGASNVCAAGRELAIAAKLVQTNKSLSFAPQTN